jgi:hypothetical protein
VETSYGQVVAATTTSDPDPKTVVASDPRTGQVHETHERRPSDPERAEPAASMTVA